MEKKFDDLNEDVKDIKKEVFKMWEFEVTYKNPKQQNSPSVP